MCAGIPNMLSSVPLLVLGLTTIIAAPAAVNEGYIFESAPLSVNRFGSRVMEIRTADDISNYGGTIPQLIDNVERVVPKQTTDDDIPKDVETVPQKRAALVLDRILVALQKALREENKKMQYERPDRDEPRVAPLRIADDDFNDMSSLERRGQTNSGRGRVLRCYFNAVTCF